MENSLSFKAVIGVNAGYGHSNETNDVVRIVAEKWQRVAGTFFKVFGVYVSSIVEEGKVVYSTDWGCPVGGEVTAIVTGTHNREFSEESMWRKVVLEVVEQVAQDLEQATATIEFSRTDLVYLKKYTDEEMENLMQSEELRAIEQEFELGNDNDC